MRIISIVAIYNVWVNISNEWWILWIIVGVISMIIYDYILKKYCFGPEKNNLYPLCIGGKFDRCKDCQLNMNYKDCPPFEDQ